MSKETLLSAARRVVRFFNVDNTSGGGLISIETSQAIETLDKMVHAPFLDLVAHLYRAREFSEKTFGPGRRTAGVVAHIRKELAEIEAAPMDVEEWIDVAILALDGAWRTGATPENIVETLIAKQVKNENRQWPDWRSVSGDAPIEHVRTAE